jgi:hypothetical protein
VQQRYSINGRTFRPGNKERLLSYMPRKMSDHSSRLLSAIGGVLPDGWRFASIDGVGEAQVAEVMSRSVIFLAFSEFEGLPVPPVEAAISGNVVIGYHGQGGREYWKRPNFIEVNQGDLQGFIFEILDKIQEINSGQLDIVGLNSGIELLHHYFSPELELEFLQNLIGRIGG